MSKEKLVNEIKERILVTLEKEESLEARTLQSTVLRPGESLLSYGEVIRQLFEDKMIFIDRDNRVYRNIIQVSA